MFTATRMAAAAAILALSGSLALLTGPLSPNSEAPPPTGAEAPGPEAASWFSGSGGIRVIDPGEEWTDDGVGHLRGQVSAMEADDIEVDDPRAGGTATFTQHADSYGGFGPTWGSMRIEDEDGSWTGDLAGVYRGSDTSFSGWLIGDGSYEGLVQYREYSGHGGSFTFEFSGAILPADALPLDAELTPPEPVDPEPNDEGED